MEAATEAHANRVTVPLRSRRVKRVQLVQKLQHAVPAFGLLMAGVQSLTVGARGVELGLAVAGIGIHTHTGRRRRLDFKDLENAADVRAALEKAQQRLIPEEQQ